MLSHSQLQVSKEVIDSSTQYALEQQRRDPDPLVVRGSSVLDKDRAEDEALTHNRQRHKQVINIFTRQLRNELAGKAKSGEAAQIGGYLLHSLDKTISTDQLKQEAASQRLLVLGLLQLCLKYPLFGLFHPPLVHPLRLSTDPNPTLL